jgi:haloalkane dehalogenase
MDDVTLPVSIREQWPWQPRFARVNGWRMHYIDEGLATRSSSG